MSDIAIKVNGKNVPLSEFPAEFIVNTITGMLSSLKGVDEIHDLEIKIMMWFQHIISMNK